VSSTRKQSVWLVTAAAIAVLLVACEPGDPGRSTGSYPIDIFQEMHYNQSFKSQEPPRLSPPAGSFPVSGGFIPAPPKSEAADLTSPFPINDETLTRGALLFRQNCSMCHGATGAGNGFVGVKFDDYPAPRPPAFDSKRVQDLEPGQAFAVISRGEGFMPPFERLLSEEDRWALAALIEDFIGRGQAALAAANDFPDTDGDGSSEIERTLRLLELRGTTP
jgi:mono/diheme cytochrome c family protein